MVKCDRFERAKRKKKLRFIVANCFIHWLAFNTIPFSIRNEMHFLNVQSKMDVECTIVRAVALCLDFSPYAIFVFFGKLPSHYLFASIER